MLRERASARLRVRECRISRSCLNRARLPYRNTPKGVYYEILKRHTRTIESCRPPREERR